MPCLLAFVRVYFVYDSNNNNNNNNNNIWVDADCYDPIRFNLTVMFEQIKFRRLATCVDPMFTWIGSAALICTYNKVCRLLEIDCAPPSWVCWIFWFNLSITSCSSRPYCAAYTCWARFISCCMLSRRTITELLEFFSDKQESLLQWFGT